MNLLPVVQYLREIERIELENPITGKNGTNNCRYNTWYYGYEVSDPNGAAYAWCVVFQLWCMDKAGVDTSIFPRTASVGVVKKWFQDRNRFHQTPKVGDLVIYDWSHIGLVEKLLTDNRIQTIEGNSSDKVSMHKYDANWSRIVGYCRPDYASVKDPDRSPGGITEVILQSLPRLVVGSKGADVRRLHGLLRAANQPLPGIQNSDGSFKDEYTRTTANAVRALTGRTTVTAAQWKHLLGV